MSATEILSSGLVSACDCEVTRRGPNWLFVHVSSLGDVCGVGERLWGMAQQQFIYRIVLEFDVDTPPDPWLPVELRTLCQHLEEHSGALRLCGLDPCVAQRVLDEAGCPRLHNHASAYDAVWCGPCDEEAAWVPGQPR